MEFTVQVVDDPAGESARSLADWLSKDTDVRDNARVALQESQQSTDEMGPLADTVQLLLQPDGVLVAVLSVVGVWLEARGRRTRIRVRRGDVVVEIDTAQVDDPDEIATIVAREIQDR
ncbi:hypothetical protein [Streptomyces sp. NPDC093970]|uniref:effector-associated constant component EACC1 n=1 Tax=Streptomyces sp. NPDC093970 TaxID=3155076 RepID=UPI00341FE255